MMIISSFIETAAPAIAGCLISSKHSDNPSNKIPIPDKMEMIILQTSIW